MKINKLLFLSALGIAGLFVNSAQASLYVCQKGRCDYVLDDANLKPWIRQLHAFFKMPNARIDFCESNARTHVCSQTGLNWVAKSAINDVHFSIPVARTIPNKNTLLMDYLVSANAFLPSCSFSNSTFEPADNNTIRFVSNAFECQLTGLGKTKLQNTFFIDYIDFDNSVAGGKYTIQTHGEISGVTTGYAMMKFRDGNTLLPLVPQPYYGEMPAVPDSHDVKRIEKQIVEAQYPVEQKDGVDEFVDGVKDWWEKLKESFNLDHQRRPVPNEEPHWWNKFTDTFMKVIYLEPLE